MLTSQLMPMENRAIVRVECSSTARWSRGASSTSVPSQCPPAAAWVAMEWATDSRDTFHILKDTFDEAYNGNRAPLPIFIHSSW
jgi:hypothetical protein